MRGTLGICVLALCLSIGCTSIYKEEPSRMKGLVAPPSSHAQVPLAPRCIPPKEDATAPSEPDTVRALHQLELDWAAAVRRRDILALQLILGPDFHETDWTGRTRNRDQVLRAAPTNSTASTSHLHNIFVRLFSGKFAVVTGDAEISNPRPEVKRVHFTDVFVYRQGRWQAVSSQQTAEQAGVAGQG